MGRSEKIMSRVTNRQLHPSKGYSQPNINRNNENYNHIPHNAPGRDGHDCSITNISTRYA